MAGLDRRRGIGLRWLVALAATAALLSFLAVALASSNENAPAWRSYASKRYAFSLGLPSGWYRSHARLVPRLLMPREIVSVGTFPMPVGGGGNCGREPVAAVRRMKPGDALISIQEYVVTPKLRAHLTRNFPPRSSATIVAGLRRADLRQPYPQGAMEPLVSYSTLSFSDGGRAFDALVYFGGKPSPELRDTATSILEAMRFKQRPS